MLTHPAKVTFPSLNIIYTCTAGLHTLTMQKYSFTNDSLTNAPEKRRHDHPTAQEAKYSQTRVPHDQRPAKVERLSVSHPPPPNIYQQKIDSAYDDRDVPSPRHPGGAPLDVEPGLDTVHERDQASHAVRPMHTSIRYSHSGLTHSSK